MPETLNNYGVMVKFPEIQNPSIMATSFAQDVIRAIENPYDTTDQVDFARANYNWETRAPEWVEWLEQFI